MVPPSTCRSGQSFTPSSTDVMVTASTLSISNAVKSTLSVPLEKSVTVSAPSPGPNTNTSLPGPPASRSSPGPTDQGYRPPARRKSGRYQGRRPSRHPRRPGRRTGCRCTKAPPSISLSRRSPARMSLWFGADEVFHIRQGFGLLNPVGVRVRHVHPVRERYRPRHRHP